MKGLVPLLALCIACATPAAAQSTRGLDALERRGELLGWEAVGRLDKPNGFCTGTLIASDLVLTAAHCVFDAAGQLLPPERLLFRAGYANGTAIAERSADRVVVPEGYHHSPTGMQGAEETRVDVALVRLSQPISTAEADPFRIHDSPREGDRVSVLSYGQGREETLSREGDCNVTGRYRDGLMSFDCNVTFGSSGAPVFVKYGTRVRILSLISGGTNLGTGDTVSFGMELPALVDDLKQQLRTGGATAVTSGGARRITVGGGMGDGGARFVRPGGS